MKWTKEKPTEPGWYFVAEKGLEQHKSARKIVEVFKHGDNLYWNPKYAYPRVWDNPNILWTGPISEEIEPV